MYHANTNNYLHHRAGVYPPALKYVSTSYIFQELLPRIFVGDKVERALLSGYVIVPDHIVAVQITDIEEPSSELYQGLIACVGELAGLVRVADFDRNGILVPVVTGGGLFVQWDALDDLTLQSDDKVGTDIRSWICIVVPVLLGSGAGIAHIVDHNIPYTLQINTTAGISVHFDNLLINPVRDRYRHQFKHLFPWDDLFLIDMPSYRKHNQKQD